MICGSNLVPQSVISVSLNLVMLIFILNTFTFVAEKIKSCRDVKKFNRILRVKTFSTINRASYPFFFNVALLFDLVSAIFPLCKRYTLE